MGYIYLVIALFCTSFGQILYKMYVINKEIRYLVSAIILFIGTPVFIYLSLYTLSFGLVFLTDSICIVLIVFLSRLILNEKIHKKQFVGMLLIILGMLLLFKDIV